MDELIAELQRRGLVVVPRDSLEPMRGSGGGGGAVFTGIQPGTYSIGGGSITVNAKGQVVSISSGGGGGGGVTNLANVGIGAEVYRPPLSGAGVADLRTLRSPSGSVMITQAVDEIELEVSTSTVQTASFVENVGTTLNVSTQADAMTTVNLCIQRTDRSELTVYRITIACDGSGTSAFSDILAVDGPNPISLVSLSTNFAAPNVEVVVTPLPGATAASMEASWVTQLLPLV